MTNFDRFAFCGFITLMSVLGYLLSGNDWRVGIGIFIGGVLFMLFGAQET